MEAMINCSQEELAKRQLQEFIYEGLQDVYNNELLDFDSVFDELEKRYDANG